MTGRAILTKNGERDGMKLPLSFLSMGLSMGLAAGAILVAPAAASAENLADMSAGFERRSSLNGRANDGGELPPYLQCVPFAREVSGIQIYGDAYSWWDQAEGRYQRGNRPQVGAVMAFQPHRNMTLGHVAAVSKVIDRRTVLISHSNWSPINGRRGQIERDVRAVDVSPDNDWSMVRVWYDPLQEIGVTAWPVHGFIYGGTARGEAKPARGENRIAKLPPQGPVPAASSGDFTRAFADLGAPQKAAPKGPATNLQSARQSVRQSVRTAQAATPPALRRSDPVRDAIARYEK